MKHGAYHYANKPFNLDEIALLVEKALETTRLRREVRDAARQPGAALQPRPHRRRVAGDGRRCKALLQQGGGEPGVDGAADRRERHRQGPGGQGHPLQQRPRAAAVHEHHLLGAARRRCSKASCSATSAARSPTRGQQKRGLLETADGGTVFLDEIGEMVPALQAKLLRFLEEKTFKRVGGSHDIQRRRARHRRDQPQPRGRGARRARSARTCSTG